MKELLRVRDKMTKVFIVMVGFCFFAILLLVVSLVILRYLFNTTIVGGNEVVGILFVYVSAVGAAVLVGRREHIAITLFVEKMPRFMQKFFEIVSCCLITLLNLIIIRYSVKWITVTGGYLMPSTQLPQATSQIIIPIASCITILYCIINIFLTAFQDKEFFKLSKEELL